MPFTDYGKKFQNHFQTKTSSQSYIYFRKVSENIHFTKMLGNTIFYLILMKRFIGVQILWLCYFLVKESEKTSGYIQSYFIIMLNQ